MEYGVFYDEYEKFDNGTMRFTGERYLSEAAGSDAYVRLDARFSRERKEQIMRVRAKGFMTAGIHCYKAFRLYRGRSISDMEPYTEIIKI